MTYNRKDMIDSLYFLDCHIQESDQGLVVVPHGTTVLTLKSVIKRATDLFSYMSNNSLYEFDHSRLFGR